MAQQRVRKLGASRPAPRDFVEIEHDDIEKTARVSPRSVPHWEARGWRVVEPAPAGQEPTTATPAPEDPPTDDDAAAKTKAPRRGAPTTGSES